MAFKYLGDLFRSKDAHSSEWCVLRLQQEFQMIGKSQMYNQSSRYLKSPNNVVS